MDKLDYKKLWIQQKKDNIRIVSENVKLIKEVNTLYEKAENFEGLFRKEADNAKSWEYLRNIKAGEIEGIMRCFKELLNNKNQQK
jgi:hypothetical protein